jgi:hypothetical protein
VGIGETPTPSPVRSRRRRHSHSILAAWLSETDTSGEPLMTVNSESDSHRPRASDFF